ncbi:MAG: hypothetical protein IJX42_02170, partial [Oscillospiraceae bacterium]|nr:hypothetical protein [Oscillospiraceae bacterium]
IVLDAQVRCENPDADPATCTRNVYVTIGMFSIVQLSRPVPLLIPAYDYCVPEKECVTNTESPCELFERIDFPTREFFPQGLDDNNCDCGCGNTPDCSDC